jgi:leader peptidase (prepilin peptidase)/N-methyltransferase
MLELSGLRDALTSSVWTWPCVAALIGVQIGSFINLLVWRLPQMMQREWEQQCAELQGQTVTNLPVFNLATPGSHCTSCATPLRSRDLVPVLSFVFLKGRCAHCNTKVSWRYPLVESAVALLWAFCAWRWGVGWGALAWAGFATTLLALALIDADTLLLPDSLTLPLMWAGILLASVGVINLSLEQSVWGAALGYAVLWLVQTVFGAVTGKQGMGEGDYKLLAALGAWLGWMALPAVVLIASVSGVLLAMLWRWRGRLQAGQPMPFGPQLAAAGAASAVWQTMPLDLFVATFWS